MDRPFGKYRLQRVLGKGGMGIVYLAYDEALQRQVALKTLSPELARKPDFVARFLAEARTAARLHDPHVVAVFDHGEEREQPYIAMEYVEGITLSQLLEQEGPLVPQRARAILGQIAQGLAQIHKLGVIHRDIKPANLLVNEHGLVKIADFGIARLLDQTKSYTQAGHVMGSLGYLSPEACQGKSCDGRSDIFSLGVVYYYLLTGQLPEQGAIGYPKVEDQNGHLDPLASLEPLDQQLLRQMLAFDLNARFPDCETLLKALNAHEVETVSAGTKNAKPSTPRRKTGSQGRAIILATCLLLVGIAGIWYSGPSNEKHGPNEPLDVQAGLLLDEDASGLESPVASAPEENRTGRTIEGSGEALDGISSHADSNASSGQMSETSGPPTGERTDEPIEPQPEGYEAPEVNPTGSGAKATSGAAPEGNTAASGPMPSDAEPLKPTFPLPHPQKHDALLVVLADDELASRVHAWGRQYLPQNHHCWDDPAMDPWFAHVGSSAAREELHHAGLQLLIVVRFQATSKSKVSGGTPIQKGILHLEAFDEGMMLFNFPVSIPFEYTAQTLGRKLASALKDLEARLQEGLENRQHFQNVLALSLSESLLWQAVAVEALESFYPGLSVRVIESASEREAQIQAQYLGASWLLWAHVQEEEIQVPEVEEEESDETSDEEKVEPIIANFQAQVRLRMMNLATGQVFFNNKDYLTYSHGDGAKVVRQKVLNMAREVRDTLDP